MTVQSDCSKKKCSDFDGSGTSRLETIKCGANLVSDKKVDFSQKTPSQTISLFNPAQPHMPCSSFLALNGNFCSLLFNYLKTAQSAAEIKMPRGSFDRAVEPVRAAPSL